jgi:hypothetical protein
MHRKPVFVHIVEDHSAANLLKPKHNNPADIADNRFVRAGSSARVADNRNKAVTKRALLLSNKTEHGKLLTNTK